MTPEIIQFLVAAGVLAFLSAIISAVETAVFALTASGETGWAVRSPMRLPADPRLVHNSLLLADTLVNMVLVLVCLVAFSHITARTPVPFWLLSVTVFPSLIVACDLAPKVLALARPETVCRLGGPLIGLLVRWLSPASRVLERAGEAIVAATRLGRLKPLTSLTEEELETLVEMGREEGALSGYEGGAISELLKLGTRTARHFMTPRMDVFFLPDNLGNPEASTLLRGKRYRRVPVRGETPDDVLGVLDVKEFLLSPTAHYTEMIQPPSFIPETMGASELLRSFLNHRQHLAIILDEYGGIEGIVTLSDLLEQILGEESPGRSEELYIERLGAGRIIASGIARLDDLPELAGHAGEADTVGGLVVEQLGHLARPGTEIQFGDHLVTVRRATSTRVKEVLIEPHTQAGQADVGLGGGI